jgi:hypothetical protein
MSTILDLPNYDYHNHDHDKHKDRKPAKTLNRQKTIHLLPVPFELAELINSYCFYDKITSKTRKLKQFIHLKFHYAYDSRKNPYEWGGDDPDNCEQWSIELTDKNLYSDPRYPRFDAWTLDTYEEKQFQATNCKSCGNYKISSTSGYSVFELACAIELENLEWCEELRSRMQPNIRCECLIRNNNENNENNEDNETGFNVPLEDEIYDVLNDIITDIEII